MLPPIHLLIFAAAVHLILSGCGQGSVTTVIVFDTKPNVDTLEDAEPVTPLDVKRLQDTGLAIDTPIDSAPEDATHDTYSGPSTDCGDDALYLVSPIENWRVCVSVDLQTTDPLLASEALEHLEGDLDKVEGLLDPSIVQRLQEVRIWLERDVPQFPGGVYHPSPDWLADNGYPEYWAEGVQLGNAANYLDWTNIQPAMVLHELTHAWHHQVLGYDQLEIKSAYEAAMESGMYNNVAYAGGGTDKAYGTNNHIEYFAELTEAYFWENDFYPFQKTQLATFDPQGYQAVENAWKAVQ
jgi:hypothetical protein